jgi:hypothetical protein
MATNPYEQFVTPAENPYAQFVTPAPQAPSGGIPDGRRKYSLGEVPVAAVENLYGSGGRFLGGVYEAVTSPVQTLSSLLDIGAGALRNTLPKQVTGFIDSFDADPANAVRASQAASAVGGMYKDRYGDYESIKRTFAEDPVGAAADLSTLLTGGGAAASKVGAANVGAAATKMGAAINPMRVVAPIVEVPIKAAAKGVGAVYNALAPKATAYLTAVEGRGPQIVNALKSGGEIVPGSMPTAAQAASGVGATKFSALGAEAASKLPTPFFARGEAQKAAQLGQVQSVGGTPATLTAAENIRSATAKNLYGISDQALVNVDKTFTSLLDRPSMNKVLARAKELADEKGQPFQIGQTKAAQTTPSVILNAEGKPMGTTVTPAEMAKYPGSSLHDMKMAFDDLINNPERFGIGASEANAIKGTRGQFLKWAEEKAPDYRVARETFAAQSKPINKMQVGQYLEGKLMPALGEETAALRASGFAGAMENAPTTLKTSTGQSRFQKLTEVLDPEDIAKLESVRADLARAKLTEQQAKAASKSGVDLGKVAAESLGGLRAPSLISTVTSVANDIMRRLQGKLDNKLAIEIATEMLDPAAAAKAIELALARQARGEAIAAPVKAAAKVGSKVLRTPAAVNMLAAEQENQNALTPRIDLRGMNPERPR